MSFEDKLAFKLHDYFNKILRDALKYKETFRVIVGGKGRTVLLDTNSNQSELIKKLKDDTFKSKIVSNIQSGLNKVDTDKFEIQIIIISENEFVIQY